MEKLFIESSKSTPKIDFNPRSNTLLIDGQSYPENAFKFYEQIFSWVDKYLEGLESASQVKIYITLPYINTSSSKSIMVLLDKFDKAFLEGKKVTLTWHYDLDNDSELECAKEFLEDINMPFNIVACE